MTKMPEELAISSAFISLPEAPRADSDAQLLEIWLHGKVAYSGTGVASIARIPGVSIVGLKAPMVIYTQTTGYQYAATASGVFRSKNQGNTWTEFEYWRSLCFGKPPLDCTGRLSFICGHKRVVSTPSPDPN